MEIWIGTATFISPFHCIKCSHRNRHHESMTDLVIVCGNREELVFTLFGQYV